MFGVSQTTTNESAKTQSKPKNKLNTMKNPGYCTKRLDKAMKWIKDNWKKEIFSVINYILKLSILALVIYLLGSSFYGNWLRCKLLDTQGCLPKLIIDAKTTGID